MKGGLNLFLAVVAVSDGSNWKRSIGLRHKFRVGGNKRGREGEGRSRMLMTEEQGTNSKAREICNFDIRKEGFEYRI